MTMSPEVEQEYQQALTESVVRRGTVVSLPGRGRWGWQDYEASRHLNECGGSAPGVPTEDYWYEYAGTNAGPEDGKRIGLVLYRVTCNCGQLDSREVRWDEHISNVAEELFAAAAKLWR
jgi:hypothetical protein